VKKLAITFIVLLAVGIGVIYVFRYNIFQYSAETIIKKNLPPYLNIDSITFDFKSEIMRVKDLGIKNPKGYKNKYLARIDSINCGFRMKGKNILDGIEVTDIITDKAVINIERLSNGRINATEMGNVMGSGQAKKGEKKKGKNGKEDKFDVSRWIKLTATVNIKDGKVVFIDNYKLSRPYMLTFDDINGDLVIRLNEDYTAVRSVASEGTGYLDGDMSQEIRWRISLDPGARELTMSNRFEVSGVDITLFKPYYDKYSPILVDGGRCSGTLVFDFDNGNIGSMNTLSLKDLKFRVKESSFAAQFWGGSIPDIIKYLQTSPGEITFDFKIKGNMEDPEFYPGPVVKQAIQNMVVDKVSEFIEKAAGPEEGEGGEQSDTQKVMGAIKELLKKRNPE